MTWLGYSLLAAAVYATVIFTDKFIVRGGFADPRGVVLYGSAVGLVLGTLLWFICGRPVLPPRAALLVVGSGIFTIFASVFYFRAIYETAASTVIILMQVVPLIVLLMSRVVLHEPITGHQLAGIFLVVSAAMGIAATGKREGEHGDLTLRAMLHMLAAALLWSAANVSFKMAAATATFGQLVAYESWGIFLGGLGIFICLPGMRRAFLGSLASTGKRAVGLVALNESIFVAGKLLMFYAISLGPVTLVSAVGSTQVFFAVAYGWGLTLIAPKIFAEDITAPGLARQVCFAALMFAGVWLMA